MQHPRRPENGGISLGTGVPGAVSLHVGFGKLSAGKPVSALALLFSFFPYFS